MDNATVLACAVNAAALVAHAAAFFVWKGQVTERVDALRARLSLLERDLRDGGCPAFGRVRREIESSS